MRLGEEASLAIEESPAERLSSPEFSRPPLFRRTLEGAIHRLRIACLADLPYDARMPTLIFWILVVAVVLFFKLTTKAERRSMIETYWVIIVILGVIGFAWQLLRQGHFSS